MYRYSSIVDSINLSLDTSILVNYRWEIESRIDFGSTGVVYAAKDVYSGETVAVKLEYRYESLLGHETYIYQRLGCFDKAASRAFGLPFIHFYGAYGPDHDVLVMDCLGPSLETGLEREEIMDQEASSKVAVQALNILQYIHSQGIVHCDVKPANLLRGRNDADALHLVDFGISETHGTGRRFEELRKIDLQDLGTTLYEIRTGNPYYDKKCSSGVVPEVDRYFEQIKSDQMQNCVDYTALRRMFEDFRG